MTSDDKEIIVIISSDEEEVVSLNPSYSTTTTTTKKYINSDDHDDVIITSLKKPRLISSHNTTASSSNAGPTAGSTNAGPTAGSIKPMFGVSPLEQNTPYKYIPKPRSFLASNRCFGMLETEIHIIQQRFFRKTTEMLWVPLQIASCEPTNPSYPFPPNPTSKPVLRLYSSESNSRDVVADINYRFCSLLACMVSLLRFEVRANSLEKPPQARILVYGNIAHGAYVANQLSMNNLFLVAPDIQPKLLYANPQLDKSAFTAISHQIAEYSNTKSETNPAADPVDKQIQQLYKTLTPPENLAEETPDPRLSSTLFKYQKQALSWMLAKELGKEQVFWKKENGRYTNVFTSKTISTCPEPIRGGILADDMGLGKTIQIISLILKNQPTGPCRKLQIQQPEVENKPDVAFGFRPLAVLKQDSVKSKITDNPKIASVPSKATLIICPLSTVHNWEDQIVSHTHPDSLQVLVHHGPGRSNNAKEIASYDVVITTYNIIGMGISKNNLTPLHHIYWHRIVLDEAHIIKSSSTSQAKAAFLFMADIRWCLTGTPLQNKLDDLFSLIRFLQVKPLDQKSEWSYRIAKPIMQTKSASAFSRLQILMKGLTLRRTKSDRVDGVPIIQLPPRTEVVRLLELDTKERALYLKVFTKGKEFLRELQARGAVMKNYIMILKAILMMRQACLHPALVKFESLPTINDLMKEEADLVSLDIAMPAEEAKSLFKFLRQAGEDNCVFCSNALDGSGCCAIPCKHLICGECIQSRQNKDSSSSSSSVLTPNLSCPLCKIPFNRNSLAEISEADIESPDEGKDNLMNLDSDFVGTTLPTKLRALISDLELVRAEDFQNDTPVTKSVVFSQFTAMLTLCEKPLEDAGFEFVRLDGAMSRAQRGDAQRQFKNDPNVTVFLISIKAGGVGLNLTTANRVYLLEPYWNPAVEQQAIDRVHRLGQTRPVTTIRLIVKNSVEVNMQDRQKYKTALAEKALDKDSLEEGTEIPQRRRNSNNDREATLKEKMESLMILFRG